MSIHEIGCCGAYCGTCSALKTNLCKGCKLGYDNGIRNLSKAKCKIKVCCIGKNHISCADCINHNTCAVLNAFYKKNGQKYKKYKQATDYIIQHGYDAFLAIANKWKYPSGKY